MFRDRHTFRSGRWGKAQPGAEGSFEILHSSVIGLTTTTATIRWDATAVCSGYLEWGETVAYGSDNAPGAELEDGYQYHIQTIENLDPDTLYYFRCNSTDAYGNTATSTGSLTTQALPAASEYGPRTQPSFPTGAYIIPSTIDDTGTTDVTAALQSFIDGVGAGASPTNQKVIVWDQTAGGAGSTYRITLPLVLDSANDNVRHFGWNTKIHADHADETMSYSNPSAGSQSQVFSVFGCSGFTFEGFDIYGNNGTADNYIRLEKSGEWQQGMVLRGDCQDVVIKDNIFRQLNGDAVNLNANGVYAFDRITIEHNLFYDLERQILGINQGQNIEVAWNILRDCGIYPIDLAEDCRASNGSGFFLRDVDIHDNVIAGWGWHLTAIPGVPGSDWYRSHAISSFKANPADMTDISRITIRDNRIGDASKLYGAQGTGASEGIGALYLVDDPASPMISFRVGYPSTDSTTYYDIVVTGNTFDIPTAQKVRPAANFYRTQNITVTDNVDMLPMTIVRYLCTGDYTYSGNT